MDEVKKAYEAGREAEREDMNLQMVSLSDLLLKHRQAGIREVIEFVDKMAESNLTLEEIDDKWQTSLKEKGIK